MPLSGPIRRLLITASVLLAVFAVSFFGLAAYLYSLSLSLPDLGDVDLGTNTPRNSVVYAADGSVLAEWHGDENRKPITSADIPDALKWAVVSVEDRRFYQHQGVDWQAIGRAARANADARQVRQGGSTITQQLVKLTFTTRERTLTRKIKEALLAYELEGHAEKDEVLVWYLNTVYFGNGAYGVESASQRYFGKSTADLSLPECASLAGIIRSPRDYDPVGHPVAAVSRRNLVLRKMREQGYITANQEKVAASAELGLAKGRDSAQIAPYFVEWVRGELLKNFGAARVYSGGLRVYTTLQPAKQRAAERAATLLSEKGDPEVAIVSLNHGDGSVVAMVGGRDFSANQFNLATQGKRQPGSAFKPFVLVTALERGVKPDQTFSTKPYSAKVPGGTWRVQNYESSKTDASVSLRTATEWSINAVYARLIMRVGPKRVVEVARKMGIVSPLEPDPAIALGGLKQGVSPLEMASAYGTLANGGYRVVPTGIQRVTDEAGLIIYEPETPRKRVLKEPVVAEATQMLHDVIEKGTGSKAGIDAWAAGKTGTTQSYRDAWFVGWSEGLSTAVWVGHPQAQVAMTDVHGIKVTGGSFPARIWSRYMSYALRRQSDATAPVPAEEEPQELAKALVCTESLMLANVRCPEPMEMWLPPEALPKRACRLH